MEHIYNRKSLPPIGESALRALDQAAGRLLKKLEALVPAQLPISEYGRENLEGFQRQARDMLKKYVHVLGWILAPEARFKGQTFVDYGGGHGILGCLAREAGFETVVYNDIFEECCADAEVIARQLGCSANSYVCGEIDVVQKSMNGTRPASCALASINVIEHIYDMDAFIRTASALSTGPMTLVLSTSANPLNPLVRRRHYRQHRLWEFKDGPHEGSYPLDTPRAFRTVRREIIEKCAADLNERQVGELTEATRGLRKSDIERVVKDFQATGKILIKPEHPTNTCDPLTGSWQERLLDIQGVTTTLEECGFSVKVLGGYYSGTAGNAVVGKAKRAAAYVLNQGISWLGTTGTRLAPCFMFQAVRKG